MGAFLLELVLTRPKVLHVIYRVDIALHKILCCFVPLCVSVTSTLFQLYEVTRKTPPSGATVQRATSTRVAVKNLTLFKRV